MQITYWLLIPTPQGFGPLEATVFQWLIHSPDSCPSFHTFVSNPSFPLSQADSNGEEIDSVLGKVRLDWNWFRCLEWSVSKKHIVGGLDHSTMTLFGNCQRLSCWSTRFLWSLLIHIIKLCCNSSKLNINNDMKLWKRPWRQGKSHLPKLDGKIFQALLECYNTQLCTVDYLQFSKEQKAHWTHRPQVSGTRPADQQQPTYTIWTLRSQQENKFFWKCWFQPRTRKKNNKSFQANLCPTASKLASS
jgi:hypothetical protein